MLEVIHTKMNTYSGFTPKTQAAAQHEVNHGQLMLMCVHICL